MVKFDPVKVEEVSMAASIGRFDPESGPLPPWARNADIFAKGMIPCEEGGAGVSASPKQIQQFTGERYSARELRAIASRWKQAQKNKGHK